MDSHSQPLSSSFSYLHFLSIILLLIQPRRGSGFSDKFYRSCSNNFSCGQTIPRIGFPFYGSNEPAYCGHPGFALSCDEENSVFKTTIDIMYTTFRVLGIDQSKQSMKIAREDLMVGNCPEEMVNTTLDFSLFDYTSSYANITFLFNCPDSNISDAKPISCGKSGYSDAAADYVSSGTRGPGNCETSVTVPVPISASFGGGKFLDSKEIDPQFFRQGLEVRYKTSSKACIDCLGSKGRCGYNLESNQETCFCLAAPYISSTCSMDSGASPDKTQSSGKEKSKNTGMIIGLPIAGAVLAGAVFGWLIFYYKQRRKDRKQPLAAQAVAKDITTPHPSSTPLSTPNSSNFTRSIPSYPSSNSDLDRGSSSYFGVQVFSYAELEQATDNFNSSRELGDGGFGVVYYGELPDGRTVAVKRLYENNYRRLEQFMNEVEILTQLRHPNLVALYGCTSKRSRELLLVYEYIPNGTVSDHLHGSHTKSSRLSWPVRLSIAVETAEALGYLHRSKIIHRDVKTNNILLDNNLHVKVADFGLSRLFPTGVTHVSTAPQGTPGYVDPEYYQCYHLTEKSDVYSFGVVLIELISSLMAVDTSRHRHDINLANMAVNKIQNHALQEMVDPSLGFKTNPIVRRKITLVAELAFQCLQPDRDMRPSMDEVLDALKGIHSDDMNANKAEAVEILVDSDETGPLRGSAAPSSPPEA
ncbi:LEAF RUST 10 DISEASE-RESISTANCE LOCUS RECEPTOR-LIKE PROTEIN KINASE-like 1.2 isoform X2 [Andrographis paniculata]|uniref:LEAF RUST 10 DISEASE-RESISTANCE LOCUS RECEPTOR-LIKE PROTEIN KINASE-like 1.2 isoform X2 n=1 Tax=Andrographis paniculata TaxID=175694 RepID=UPI0021E83FE0|nr:LEAF RUST 10 DISEASE-RESISTANCE LOCUS RECEPTOR-LIKE PROTEIN KINASE-like 1.2 isoform X2 [Andrographis paniculata]